MTSAQQQAARSGAADLLCVLKTDQSYLEYEDDT